MTQVTCAIFTDVNVSARPADDSRSDLIEALPHATTEKEPTMSLPPRPRRSPGALLALALCVALAFPVVAPATMQPTTEKKAAKIERKIDLKDAKIPYANGELLAPTGATTAPSGQYEIDALLSGYTWSLTTVTYSFYEDSVFGGAYYGSEPSVREVSEAVKTNVRAIMSWYSSVMGLNLVEVTETPTTIGLIRIMDSSAPNYAYAYYPSGTAMFSVSGDVHLNTSYDRLGDTNGFQHPAGQHGYLTLAHEIGHALGLKHSFEGRTVLPAAEDNTANTIMTYTFTGSSPGTPMVYDLRALQHIYGTRAKNTGDDTYTFTSRGTSQYTLSGATLMPTPYQTKQAIWDTGGFDTIDASGLPAVTGGYRFDLGGGGWLCGTSQFKTSYFDYGSALGYTFLPERFVNSGGADTIYANSTANVFAGYSADRITGADVIHGAVSADTVDLSGYGEAQVTRTTVGTDLVLGLGVNGSITLKGYYAGATPTISFGVVSPPPVPNQAPTAVASGSPSSGYAPLPVAFDGGGSSDSDGSIVSYAWDFGDGTTGTGSTTSHTYASPGTYTAKLTVTDDDGATASATTVITVVAAPSTKLHIASIALSTVALKRGTAVRAVVTIVDEAGRAVGSAVVSGKFTGVVTSATTATTSAAGQATLTSGAIKKSGTATFTVTGITPPAGYAYDASANALTSKSISVTK